jgi:hypothetical protein
LQCAAGGGSLVGRLTAAVVSHTRRQALQIAVGTTLFGIFRMLFALSPAYALSVAPVFTLGLTRQFYMTSVNQTLQLHLPEQLRRRGMGNSGLTWEITPIGGTFAGSIAGIAGAPVAVLIGRASVAGSALRIVWCKNKMKRLEPQPTPTGFEARASI